MLNACVSHNLATSAHYTRSEESASALSLGSGHYGVNLSYKSITREMVDACAGKLGEVLYNRCSYILEENQRVLDAAEALQKEDIVALGNLLNKSQLGQRKKYEVSCPKLDFLVEMSRAEQVILGARMAGVGFGGCKLNIFHEDEV
ncbi:hypothetical protein [Flagellimonas marinaquae]|uniref:hypothetical protein n=1 Tax=Flagellimonas marinaquae TaxID=254955 RepID=UPI000F8ED0D1|nr:hypothetical protein [Allomuricauda aquimarina]